MTTSLFLSLNFCLRELYEFLMKFVRFLKTIFHPMRSATSFIPTILLLATYLNEWEKTAAVKLLETTRVTAKKITSIIYFSWFSPLPHPITTTKTNLYAVELSKIFFSLLLLIAFFDFCQNSLVIYFSLNYTNSCSRFTYWSRVRDECLPITQSY